MTDVVVTAKDIVIEVEQPTTPSGAQPPPKVGLVEINQIVQRGSLWFTGSGAPVNPGGQYGDLYLDVDTGDIYRWDGDSWEYQGTFAPSTLTGPEILALLLPVDGAGSLLDADFLDGNDSTYFATQAGLDANSAHDTTQDTNIANNAAATASNLTLINSNTAAITGLQDDNATQDTAIAGKVAKAGDTMTGPLTLVTPPTQPAYAASKAYVDAQIGGVPAAIPPATVPPLMDGTAAVGTTTKYAREDHRHPSDTSKIGDAPNDGTQYVRKSLAWSPVVVPPGTVVSDTPPASPLQGQMWFKSDTGALYTWYVDANSAAWVQVSASPQVAAVSGDAGKVDWFAMQTPPTGWLKANGAAVSRVLYPALFTAIGTVWGAGDGSTTFNVPDARGNFTRGWADGGSVDPGRAFGSLQDHLFASHNHGVSDPGHLHQTGYGVGAAAGSNARNGPSDVVNNPAPTTIVATGITIQLTGGAETRPRNIALLGCIKY